MQGNNQTNRGLRALTGLFAGSVLLAGCGGSDGSDGEPSGPIISNISTTGSPIYPGGQVQVHVSASSPSGEPLNYSWDIPEGWDGTDTGDDMLVVTAPDDQAAEGRVTVEVSDDERTRSADVVLATRGPAIEDFSITPLPPEGETTFTVDAYNRDGSMLRHHYDIGATRIVEDHGREWVWNAPDAMPMGGRYLIRATVEDESGFDADAGVETIMEGASEWPAYGRDRQRTSHTPSQNGQAAEGEKIWSAGAGSITSQTTSPILGADGRIYVARDEHVVGVDPDTRVSDLVFESDELILSNPSVGADGTIHVGSGDNHVYAIDPDDGSEIWSFETGGRVQSSPALGVDGTVYVGSEDHHVYALDPDDGSKTWAFETDGEVVSSPALGADGTVYVGSADDHVYALDPDDGSEVWAFETGSQVHSSPAVGTDGIIYIGSRDRNVYALEPDPKADNRVKWSFETGGPVLSSPALGADGTVYAGSDDGRLYALDPAPEADTRKRWSFEPDLDAGSHFRASPAVGPDGTVYAGLTVVEDGATVVEDTGRFYAIDPDDGRKKWDLKAPEAPDTIWSRFGSPAIGADGTIYVISSNYYYGPANDPTHDSWIHFIR